MEVSFLINLQTMPLSYQAVDYPFRRSGLTSLRRSQLSATTPFPSMCTGSWSNTLETTSIFEGFLDLQPLFDAAKKAGLYLIARPGPYINAETTAGRLPGWGVRVPGAWRTANETYLEAMEPYVRHVSQMFAGAQVTNGGPLILAQPENEYSYCLNIPNCSIPFPQPQYMQRLQDLMHEEGITAPTITNEVVATSQNYQPGSGLGEVDMRGYDNYALGLGCGNHYN